MNIKLLEGRIYLCSDNRVRKLNKVEGNLIHYSEPVSIISNKPKWSSSIVVNRNQSEVYFTNGKLISEDRVFLVWSY